MTKKTGKNIMTLAKVLAIFDAITSIVLAIVLWWDWGVLPGFIALGIGIAATISCWPLYGFGRLVDDVNAIRASIAGGAEPKAVEADELPEL